MNILSKAIIEYVKDKHPEWNVDLHYETNYVEITTKSTHGFMIEIDIPRSIISSYSIFSGFPIVSTNYTEDGILPQITSIINRINEINSS